MFNRFAKGDRSAIHPNIRGSVYGIALRNGGEKEVREPKPHTDAREAEGGVSFRGHAE